MRKIGSIALAILLMTVTGCNKSNEVSVPVATPPIVEATEQQEEVYKLTKEDFEPFFKKYFSLSEEELLVLNRNPLMVKTNYWENYSTYQKKLMNLLGDDLADTTKKEMNKQYVQDKIDLPKKALINDYFTYGSAQVENVEITSTRPLGEHMIYEVAVTTKNKVEKVNELLENYGWDNDNNYYTKGSAVNSEKITSIKELLDIEIDPEVFENYYLYAENNYLVDEIKMIQHYWVEVEKQDKLKIVSVKEASNLSADSSNKQFIVNTQYITRVPYYEEGSEKEKQLLIKVFTNLMQAPASTYEYYDKAYETGETEFLEVWKSLELDKDIILNKENYKDTYAKYINPYKDNISVITLNTEKIHIKTSQYSTKLQPRFVVTLPIKALLKNNEVVYYNYKYFVGVEDGKVEFIQFMNMKDSTEEEYVAGQNANNTEEQPVTPTQEATPN